MTTVEVLTAARALVARGWTRGALHRNGRYCAYGALDAVTLDADEFIAARGCLWDAIKTPNLGHAGITVWNDAQKSKKSVLAAFDRAIELATEPEPVPAFMTHWDES